MKKLVLYIVISLFVMGSLTQVPSMASESAMTKAEFVELYVRAIGAEIPEGTERLSDAEYYEVLTNILASSGVEVFVETDPESVLKCEDMVDGIYEFFGGKKELTFSEEMQFLVDNEFMPYCDPKNEVSLEFAIEVLNSPAFAKIVAETYREPERGGRGLAGLGAPGAVPDEPASKI